MSIQDIVDFFSTTQGINLPGSFAYYPIPGWHQIYDVDEMKYTHNYLKNNPEFNLKIVNKGNYNINVNLPEKDKNGKYQCFNGNTTALTITGSHYFEERKYEGTGILYSNTDKEIFSVNKSYFVELFKILKKNGFESSDKKIVLYDSGGEDYCCVTNTGIYGRLVELPDYIQSLKESDKDYFRYVMESGK